ncbi:helix-turn-helix domain-containing protein, partial [Escherichia coli]|nr:helix-turn-helix domain-containing protein [Escherichia coli]
VGGDMKPKLLKVDQVLELLNISRGKLYKLLHGEPSFPCPIKIGGQLYFISEEIDEFISSRRRVKYEQSKPD